MKLVLPFDIRYTPVHLVRLMTPVDVDGLRGRSDIQWLKRRVVRLQTDAGR